MNDDGTKLLADDQMSILKHQLLIPDIIDDLNNLNDLGLLLTGASNRELANSQNVFVMLEDKYLSMFTFIDLDYVVDIINGLESPLPDTWKLDNPN